MIMASKKNLQQQMKEILSFKNDKERLQFEAEIINLDIMHKVQCLMDENKINKTELAKQLNISKGYITQLFTADKLINLKTLAKLQRIFKVKFDMEYETLKKFRMKKLKFKKPDFEKPKLTDINIHKILIKESTYVWYKMQKGKKQLPVKKNEQKVA